MQVAFLQKHSSLWSSCSEIAKAILHGRVWWNSYNMVWINRASYCNSRYFLTTWLVLVWEMHSNSKVELWSTEIPLLGLTHSIGLFVLFVSFFNVLEVLKFVTTHFTRLQSNLSEERNFTGVSVLCFFEQVFKICSWSNWCLEEENQSLIIWSTRFIQSASLTDSLWMKSTVFIR